MGGAAGAGVVALKGCGAACAICGVGAAACGAEVLPSAAWKKARWAAARGSAIGRAAATGWPEIGGRAKAGPQRSVPKPSADYG